MLIRVSVMTGNLSFHEQAGLQASEFLIRFNEQVELYKHFPWSFLVSLFVDIFHDPWDWNHSIFLKSITSEETFWIMEVTNLLEISKTLNT